METYVKLCLNINFKKFKGYVGSEIGAFSNLIDWDDPEMSAYGNWLNEYDFQKDTEIPLAFAKLFLGDLRNRGELDQCDPDYIQQGKYFYSLYEEGHKQLEEQLETPLPILW